MPIMYQHGADVVYGFIDRLILADKTIFLLDYKTHALQKPQDVDILTARYQPQLRLYQQGVAKCWPGRLVQCYLLFTHNAELKPVLV